MNGHLLHLVADLTLRGVELYARSGRLHVEATPGVLTDTDRAALAEHKAAIVAWLEGLDAHAPRPRTWSAPDPDEPTLDDFDRAFIPTYEPPPPGRAPDEQPRRRRRRRPQAPTPILGGEP